MSVSGKPLLQGTDDGTRDSESCSVAKIAVVDKGFVAFNMSVHENCNTTRRQKFSLLKLNFLKLKIKLKNLKYILVFFFLG